MSGCSDTVQYIVHYSTHCTSSWRPSWGRVGVGGALLAIKEVLHSQNIAWPDATSIDNPDTELFFAKITTKKIGYIFGCCYRPPSSSTHYTMSTSMCTHMKEGLDCKTPNNRFSMYWVRDESPRQRLVKPPNKGHGPPER